MANESFVIVGASLTGAKAAETLRESGFDGRIVLIGDDPERPYERPALSKDYLRGEADGPPYVHDASFYADHAIDLRTATHVEQLDVADSAVRLSDGTRLRYDRLLLATGARPRRLPVPGAELDGVLYLRTLVDSDALRARIDAGARFVTIGAGWIGAEVAASARTRGCDVTILEAAQLPLERVLGPQLGAFYRDVHLDHGVAFRGGAVVEAIEGDGKVEAVRLAGGERIAADVVVVGVGVTPRTELAEGAGLQLENGVVVDQHLRTSAPNVFAAGDIANAHHPFYGRRIRVEHWANALNQGPAAARNMLGFDEPYEHLPYFFSDQYDVGMEYSGDATASDEVLVRGDLARRELLAFWLQDGCVVAGMNINIWDVNEQVQALIRARRPVDRRRLTDPDVPLDALLPASSDSAG